LNFTLNFTFNTYIIYIKNIKKNKENKENEGKDEKATEREETVNETEFWTKLANILPNFESEANKELKPSTSVSAHKSISMAPEVPTFNIIVQLDDSRTTTISCKANDTILTLKGKIQEKVGISVEEQSLVFGTKVLENNKHLIHHNFYDNCVIYSTRRFNGGN